MRSWCLGNDYPLAKLQRREGHPRLSTFTLLGTIHSVGEFLVVSNGTGFEPFWFFIIFPHPRKVSTFGLSVIYSLFFERHVSIRNLRGNMRELDMPSRIVLVLV